MAYVNPTGQAPVMQQEDPNERRRELMIMSALLNQQQPYQPQQGGGGGGMGGGGMSGLLGKFMGGGGGVSAGAPATAGTVADFGGAGTGVISGGEVIPLSSTGAATSGGTTAGTTAGTSAGGSGFGSALASWGPWAALAAAIIGNENQAVDKGYRSDGSDYWKDLLTGEVLQQDIGERWGDKVFGDNKYGFGGDTLAGVQLSQGDFGDAWDTFKNQSTLAKLLGRGDDKKWTDYA